MGKNAIKTVKKRARKASKERFANRFKPAKTAGPSLKRKKKKPSLVTLCAAYELEKF